MKRYAWLYKFAWTFEICAALAGVVMAAVFNFPAYDKAVESDGELTATEISGLLAGTIPFLLIAFAELTKIPFATAFIEVKNIVWKLVFGFVTLCLAAITFETISSGLETSYSLRTKEVTRISLDIKNYEKKIKDNQSTNANLIDEEHNKSVVVINASYDKRILAIDSRIDSINSRFDKQNADVTKSFKSQIDGLRKSQGAARRDLDSKVSSAEKRLTQATESLTTSEKNLSNCNFSCEAEKKAVASARMSVDSINAKLDSLSKTVISGDGKINRLQAKMTKDLGAITAARSKELAAPAAERIEADAWLKRNSKDLETAKNERTATLKKARNEVDMYKKTITELSEKKEFLAHDDIVYRMSIHLFGKAETETESNANVSLMATIWFGSIGLIVAITGPFLAFAYIILNREAAPKRKSKFRALARAIMMGKRKKVVVVEEKIVEVEKIVIEKEIIHVPIFTNDPNMIDLTNTYTTEGVK